jgi:hypothetical protein
MHGPWTAPAGLGIQRGTAAGFRKCGISERDVANGDLVAVLGCGPLALMGCARRSASRGR